MKTTTPARAVTHEAADARTKRIRDDPMRRLLPTQHNAVLPVMGRLVQLETNSSKLLGHMVELFARYPAAPNRSADFMWRIVVDSSVTCRPPWPRRSTFSDEGIRYAQFGQRNFVAVDIEAREAIAFVSEGLFEDQPGFTSPFIDTLFYLTAAGLGLVPFAAACVASGRKGLLVLGGANQGKTTASYLATREALTYHADQSVFMEIADGELRGWPDFVPIAFRPETLQFLPELRSLTNSFCYCDFNFHYMAKAHVDSGRTNFVVPTCCVVLDIESSPVPNLVRLATTDSSRILSQHIPFKEDGRFEQLRLKILSALNDLPVYHLSYGTNPAIAVPFLRDLLTSCNQQNPVRQMDAS